jgi:hypothetical protein
MNPIIAKLLANKHASWSVGAYVSLEAINRIINLWFPRYAMLYNTDEVVRIVSKAIVAYAIVMTAPEKPTTPPEPPLTPKP